MGPCGLLGQLSDSSDWRSHLDIPQDIILNAFLNISVFFFFLFQIRLVSTLLPQFPYFSKTALFLFLFSSFIVRNLRLGIICLGPLAVKKLQASEPTLPSSVPQQPSLPNLLSLIMAQNGRVPVFASDDRNVTAAALSTLGGNLVWSEKLAPSPAELLAAVGRG